MLAKGGPECSSQPFEDSILKYIWKVLYFDYIITEVYPWNVPFQ